MAKWLKILLGVVLSVAIFAGAAAAVFDAHPLGGGSEAYARQRSCVEDAQLFGRDSSSCYDSYRSEAKRVETNERWLSAGAGALAVGLFWLLVYLFYIRPRSRRAEAEDAAA